MFRNNIISREFEIILHLPFKIEHLEKGPPLPFAEYRYNQNSQIDSVFYNNGSYYIINSYDTRNWIIQSNSSSNNQFNYALEYYANGNISNQNINGDYKGNFSDTKEIRVSYTYDNSNRLIDAEPFSRQYFDLKGTYTYDADGNFLNLSRSYNGDEFAYEYYSGTNRLRKVTGESDQFTYDYNGNLKNDYFNNNTDIKYDHRNLITEITRINELEDPPATYTTTYKYDEAGNRINKKVVKDDGSTMEIIVNEYYIRDVSGKEIGIYQNDTLKFWNVWGLGNEGRITADGTRYYYIKDHLGSIRAVLNENNELVEAIDYDPWGHIARYWSSTSSKYKFTGKERDTETGYDYFGARYYDARIGVWNQTEPIYDKYLSFSPYSYAINNPLLLKDINGEDVIVTIADKNVTVTMTMYYSTSDKQGFSFNSEDKLSLLKNYINDARTEWNNAANEFNSENEYQIKFEVLLIEKSEISADDIPEGENIAFYQQNAPDPGIIKGNQLRIVPLVTEDFNYIYEKTSPPYTGSHEFGHLIGLTHIGSKDSKEQTESTNIMGYNKNRKPPDKEDIKKFMSQVKLDMKRQVIKGDVSNF